jgi:uncharacterized membrane protein (UPF0127 family)
MKLPPWISRGLGLGRVTQASPEVRMRVTNATRGTLLASQLEVADHGAKRSKGLLGRTGLSQGEGLWIVPCEAVHTVGMQFAIDLVYLDRTYRVRKVRSGVGPWRISACLTAHSVLELPSGTIRDTGTRQGDKLEFSPVETPFNDS